MYEIDFLPVEADDGPSSKSGDAILVRCSVPGWSRPAVIVIDGGFQATGAAVVEHIGEYYKTDVVDLVISTHPDTDHLNGLATVIEELSVGELLIHQPRLHLGAAADDFSNIEAIEDLVDKAQQRDVVVTEPFTGISRFGGQLQILGPTEGFYKELAEAHLDEGLAALPQRG